MENLFESLGITQELIKGLKKNNITVPTKIQEKIIPLALQNKDIIGQSETGTGKTLAYLLPVFQKIDTSKKEMQTLILTPTHELAMQVFKEIELLTKNSELTITSAPIIGDINIARQIEKLKNKPHIIVGSAGRVLELIKKKKITAHTIKTIVIDEADRLLDKNNLESIKAVIKTTLKERQIMIFSATILPSTISIAQEFMKEPEKIQVENTEVINANIIHNYVVCEQRDKISFIRKLVSALNPEKAIIFINKSDEIEITTNKLQYHNLKVEGIHGTNVKEDRKKALEDFRKGKIQLLVASDIAARGLDIKGITHIFNLDIPEDPKNYLHRVGRTGRAGEKGMAVSIVTIKELELIKKYEKALNIEFNQKDLYKGNLL